MATLRAPRSGRSHRRSPSNDERRQEAVLSPGRGPLDHDVDSSTSTPTRERSVSPLPPRSVAGTERMRKDIIGLICRPEVYHTIPPTTIPPAFSASQNAPSSDASVSQLVANGQFYAAAITSATRLVTQASNIDLPTIFDLFYTRLACLSIINRACLETAAVESLEMRDLAAAMYLDPVTNEHVVPWHLRVLAVRLQSIGFKDWRRGIMSYYVLAHDARQHLAKARDVTDTINVEMWSSRLADIGVRIASMLVEMGDLETAARHLKTLDIDGVDESSQYRIIVMHTMVWLQIGDLRAARRCLAKLYDPSDSIRSPTLEAMDSSLSNSDQAKVLHALLRMAEGDFAAAGTEWEAIHTSDPTNDMVIQNRAICMLYTGRIGEASQLLEEAVESAEAAPFHSLLFNLCTFYELTSDRAKDMKGRLTERVAQKEPSSMGWQRPMADFKMESLRA